MTMESRSESSDSFLVFLVWKLSDCKNLLLLDFGLINFLVKNQPPSLITDFFYILTFICFLWLGEIIKAVHKQGKIHIAGISPPVHQWRYSRWLLWVRYLLNQIPSCLFSLSDFKYKRVILFFLFLNSYYNRWLYKMKKHSFNVERWRY